MTAAGDPQRVEVAPGVQVDYVPAGLQLDQNSGWEWSGAGFTAVSKTWIGADRQLTVSVARGPQASLQAAREELAGAPIAEEAVDIRGNHGLLITHADSGAAGLHWEEHQGLVISVGYGPSTPALAVSDCAAEAMRVADHIRVTRADQ